MKLLITGCAGFIGSNTVDYFLKKGYQVFGIDSLITGREEFIYEALKNDKFKFLQADLSQKKEYEDLFDDIDLVIHLAANADVRDGLKHPTKDIK